MTLQVLDRSTLELAQPLGEAWGYNQAEFARLVDWTEGCGRLVVEDGQAVGMALGFPWGRLGWIGDVLVFESHRGRGLGQQVTEATVEALQDHGCASIQLYATPKAIGLYQRIGFTGLAEFTIARGSSKRGRDPEVEPLADHLKAALDLDVRVFGGDRRALIERQLDDHPELSLAVLDEGGELAGFGMGRPADDVTEIGPVVVRGGQARLAQDLVDGLLVRVPEGEVEVTYPRNSMTAQTCWSCRGFVAIDAPLEMRLGPVVEQDRDSIAAAGGQELG